MNEPTETVMLSAPYLWAGGESLCTRSWTMAQKAREKNTYDCNTLLMNPTMGMKVALVLLVTKEVRNNVAAELRVAWSSYSS